MHKTRTAAAITIGVVGAFIALSWRGLNHDIYERFPDIDRKVARKAYRQMMSKAIRQEYPDDLDDYNDDQMDKLFLAEVAALT